MIVCVAGLCAPSQEVAEDLFILASIFWGHEMVFLVIGFWS